MKKLTTIFLSFALLLTNLSFVAAQTTDEVKIKTQVQKRGTGEKSRVKVKKTDGTEIKGYISQAAEDSFTVTDSATKQSTVIAYRDVKKIDNRATKGDKLAIGIIAGAAAAAAIVVISFLVLRCRNEGGC